MILKMIVESYVVVCASSLPAMGVMETTEKKINGSIIRKRVNDNNVKEIG